MWLNLVAKDNDGIVLYESGHYEASTGVLTQDQDAKIYEIKPGLDSSIAATAGKEAGPSFHFALNNKVYFDNRIPPRGFTNANFEAIQSEPVGYTYADGQYWDVTEYSVPSSTDTVEVTLYYQTLSKEYVEFLRDENVTDSSGQIIYDLWNSHGKSAPEVMASYVIDLDSDTDGDGIPDYTDNCLSIPNMDQTDADGDDFGSACECDDADSLIYPGAPPAADGKDNDCDGTVDRVPQVITFEVIGDQPEGTTEVTLSASASSGLEVGFEVLEGDADIVNNVLSIYGPGEVLVRATQPGDDAYLAADTVYQIFCVLPAKPLLAEITEGQQTMLISSVETGNVWYLDNVLITGENNDTLVASEPGTYTVQVKVDKCAGAFSDPVTVSLTSVESLTEGGITIYPNPARQRIIIDLPGELQNATLEISIVDLNGRFLLRSVERHAKDGEISLYLGRYPAGLYNYIMEDRTTGSIYTGRLVLQE